MSSTQRSDVSASLPAQSPAATAPTNCSRSERNQTVWLASIQSEAMRSLCVSQTVPSPRFCETTVSMSSSSTRMAPCSPWML